MNSNLDKREMVNVGIAQCKLALNNEVSLAAPHLGSCLGILLVAPSRNMVGMVHCLLPLSKSDPDKAKENPYMYVDTGLSELLNLFLKKGVNKSELLIYVAGGASINDNNGVFEIGKKNYTVFRKLLWKNGILIKGEHIGGNSSRTIAWHSDLKKVTVKCGTENIEL